MKQPPVASGSKSGCEVPFVPVSGSSGFSKYKQLSTRRSAGLRRERDSSRAASSPDLVGRRLTKTKAVLESSTSPTPEPSITVAVHQFRGKESGRAAVLQAHPTIHSPTSYEEIQPSASTVPSSMLENLPENGSQFKTSTDAQNVHTLDELPSLDFPTLKASDRQKERIYSAQETQDIHHFSDENDYWKRLKEVVLANEEALSNGHTPTPLITLSQTNGYSVSKQISVQASKVSEQRRSQRVEDATAINDNDKDYYAPSQAPNGGNSYGGRQLLSPKQGRPWTLIDETRDHPGMRRDSGFFQPIKHLSGKIKFESTTLDC